MNIQISGLPENQKIKSINFNILFDDSNIETNAIVSIEPDLTKTNIKETKFIEPITEASENLSETLKPVDIDISKREPKVDPNMLEESF